MFKKTNKTLNDANKINLDWLWKKFYVTSATSTHKFSTYKSSLVSLQLGIAVLSFQTVAYSFK